MDILKKYPPFVQNIDHSLEGVFIGNSSTKIRPEAFVIFPWQPQRCGRKENWYTQLSFFKTSPYSPFIFWGGYNWAFRIYSILKREKNCHVVDDLKGEKKDTNLLNGRKYECQKLFFFKYKKFLLKKLLLIDIKVDHSKYIFK